jgi:hypothetical protein
MRLSALVARVWGDITAQPVAVALAVATALTLVTLAAVGLVVLGRRATRSIGQWRSASAWQRSARLAAREPGRALAASDDRAIWHEAAPRPLPKPDKYQIYAVLAEATRLCIEAADRRDA